MCKALFLLKTDGDECLEHTVERDGGGIHRSDV